MRSRITLPSGPTGRGVRIAIVDSGVNVAHPHISSRSNGPNDDAVDSEHCGTIDGLTFDEYGCAQTGYVDRLGHGTAVAAAIREKAPDSHLFAVKVFDRTLSTSVTALVRAIEWAAHSGMHVVNLSLGTSRREHEEILQTAVALAYAKGTFIVAAGHDGTVRWLPGSLSSVISVRVDWSCPRDQFRIARCDDRPIFLASGFPREIPGVPPRHNLNGISFAVANVTGFVARAFEAAADKSFDCILQTLEQAGSSDGESRTREHRIRRTKGTKCTRSYGT